MEPDQTRFLFADAPGGFRRMLFEVRAFPARRGYLAFAQVTLLKHTL
jgi:hypothetical protein